MNIQSFTHLEQPHSPCRLRHHDPPINNVDHGLRLLSFLAHQRSDRWHTVSIAGRKCRSHRSRMMAHQSVKQLISKEKNTPSENPLSYRFITRFYYPLALTSILGLGIHPMVTFFMGQSRMPIESLAVLPVISSLVFLFRSLGLSYQEVGIALMGEKNKNFKMLRNFAIYLGIAVVLALSLITFTPLSHIWFHKVSGLSLELTQYARLPAQIMTILPALTVLISFQRALLVKNERTTPITIATSIEVFTIFAILFVAIAFFNPIGAIAATIALVIGRLSANTYLFIPCKKALK